jgi:hypothetical protein
VRLLDRVFGRSGSPGVGTGEATIKSAQIAAQATISSAKLSMVGVVFAGLLTLTGTAAPLITDQIFDEPVSCAAIKIHDADELLQDGLIDEFEFDLLKAEALDDELSDAEFDGCP